jgi:class 3 adenylate cyclase
MPGRSDPTRVATVLFLDVVGSTEIATDIGDERWRATLAGFRRLVRADLKQYHGHEEDTAGDGFFATFAQPAAAVRCAVAIARDVQSIGLDVRCGLHAGETGAVEGRPGGVAVHAAARVMALAGPAEILGTATVRDLVMGTDIEFEHRATHELKGVPGIWDILVVRSTPDPLPQPLSTEEARERLEGIRPQEPRRARRAILGAASAGVAVAVAVVIGLHAAGHHAGAVTAPTPQPAILRIDPDTNTIVRKVGTRPDGWNRLAAAVDGSLWEEVGRLEGDLIQRRVDNGSEIIDLPSVNLLLEPTYGFGSAWAIKDSCQTTFCAMGTMTVTRYHETSGRPTSFKVPGSPMKAVWDNAFRAFVAEPNTGVWYVNGADFRLRLIDPTTNKLQGSWPTGSWDFVGPGEILPTKDAVWLCDPGDHQLKRFDVKTHQVSKSIAIPGEITCPVAADDKSVWLFDRGGARTVTQLDAMTGMQLGYWAIGPSNADITELEAYAFNSLWFGAGPVVYRFDLTTHDTTSIAMPAGFMAATVVADEQTHTVWVSNSV